MQTVISRVQAADPNNGYCLVENCPPNRAVEYCHVLQQEAISRLESLEWCWGMRKNTLDLNNFQNIFPVGASLRCVFDAGLYILVPTEEIVGIYRDSLSGPLALASRDSFPSIEDRNNFEYRLIPLKDMESVPLIRQHDTSVPLTKDCFTIHLYPFTTLPTLFSHIHPKFVIASAGLRLSQLPVDRLEAIVQTFPILIDILHLYRAWTIAPPTTAESEPTYWPPYDLNKEGDNSQQDKIGHDTPLGKSETYSFIAQEDEAKIHQSRSFCNPYEENH